MRHTREILRQKWLLGRSHRDVAASLGISLGVIAATFQRARAAGLDWPTVEGVDESTLEGRLYGAPGLKRRPVPIRKQIRGKQPDRDYWEPLRIESAPSAMAASKGVTEQR